MLFFVLTYFFLVPFIFFSRTKRYLKSKPRELAFLGILVVFPVAHSMISWYLINALSDAGGFILVLVLWMGGLIGLWLSYYLAIIFYLYSDFIPDKKTSNKSKLIAISVLIAGLVLFYLFARFQSAPPAFMKKDTVIQLEKQGDYHLENMNVIKYR